MSQNNKHTNLTEEGIRSQLAVREAQRKAKALVGANLAEELIQKEIEPVKSFSDDKLKIAISSFIPYSRKSIIFPGGNFSDYFMERYGYIKNPNHVLPTGTYNLNRQPFEKLAMIRHLKYLINRRLTDMAYQHQCVDEIVQNQSHKVQINSKLSSAFKSTLSCTFGVHQYSLLGVGMKNVYGVCNRCLKTKVFKMGERDLDDKKTKNYLGLMFQTKDPMILDYIKWAFEKGYRDRFIHESSKLLMPQSGVLELKFEDFHNYKTWEGPALEQFMKTQSNEAIKAICAYEKQLQPEIEKQQ